MAGPDQACLSQKLTNIMPEATRQRRTVPELIFGSCLCRLVY